MADSKSTAIRLADRMGEIKNEFRDFRQSIKEAGSALGMSSMDAAGGSLALGAKAGIELLCDYAKKVTTPQGSFRTPTMLSGGIAMGTGALGYIVNVLAPYHFPLHWYREVPRSGSFALGVLGAKEFGQAAVVWLEKRQLAALDKLAAERQAALAASQASPPQK